MFAPTISVVIVIVAAAIYATTASSDYTSDVQCVEVASFVYSPPATNGTTTSITTTVATLYSTAVNSSATAGQTTSIGRSISVNLVGIPPGSTILRLFHSQVACTYVK